MPIEPWLSELSELSELSDPLSGRYRTTIGLDYRTRLSELSDTVVHYRSGHMLLHYRTLSELCTIGHYRNRDYRTLSDTHQKLLSDCRSYQSMMLYPNPNPNPKPTVNLNLTPVL